MKILRWLWLAVASLALANPAGAAARVTRWVIRESQPNGLVEVRVIQQGKVDRPALPPQEMIYRKIMSAHDAEQFDGSSVRVDPQLIAREPGRPLWEAVKPQWDSADEADYSHWIATGVTGDLLADSGLVVDCADTGLLFRWIYAHDHQLPIANTLAGSGLLFGHFSGSATWDALPESSDWREDERFKAALRYLFANTYTRTVANDIYPTVVAAPYVRPGSLFMIIRPQSGHTQTVQSIDLTAGINTLWGNEPASASIYPSPLLTEVNEKQIFGNWRYVEKVTGENGTTWRLIEGPKMPGYSADQFGQTFTGADAFSDWLDARLGIHISDALQLQRLVGEFQANVSLREMLTAMGLVFCDLSPCKLGSPVYNVYSTFSRDARLQTEQKQIQALISKMGSADPNVALALKQVPDAEVIPGSGLRYLDLLDDSAALVRLNADPRLSFAERWGIVGAALSPTVTLNGDAKALDILLYERLLTVQAGETLCKDGCDHRSPSITAFGTAALDQALRELVEHVVNDGAASGVTPDAWAAVRQIFSLTPLKFSSRECAGAAGACTLDDAVFAPGVSARLILWAPNPWDRLPERWGFSD